MLSAVEILELEKKVLKYRLKQRVHYLIISLCVILIGVISFYIHPIQKYFFDTKEDIQLVTAVTKPIENNLSASSVG